MAFKGAEKEQKSGNVYNKYVGMFTATVVAVNPTKDELGKLLNTTIEKDLEYTSINSENGAKKLTLSFWLKEETQGNLFNVRFNLEDTAVMSSTGKTQFINNIGSTSYCIDKSSIPTWLTDNGRSVRIAKKGEELLYKFLRNWVASNWNFEDSSVELMLDDWKSLMNGKVKEIRDIISNYPDKTICCLATVRTSEDGKEYQGVYSYEFLPSYAMNSFNAGKSYKSVDKFIEKVTDPKYGCKDFYELKPLMEYDPKKNVINNTNSPVINSQITQNVVSGEDIIDDLPF